MTDFKIIFFSTSCSLHKKKRIKILKKDHEKRIVNLLHHKKCYARRSIPHPHVYFAHLLFHEEQTALNEFKVRNMQHKFYDAMLLQPSQKL